MTICKEQLLFQTNFPNSRRITVKCKAKTVIGQHLFSVWKAEHGSIFHCKVRSYFWEIHLSAKYLQYIILELPIMEELLDGSKREKCHYWGQTNGTDKKCHRLKNGEVGNAVQNHASDRERSAAPHKDRYVFFVAKRNSSSDICRPYNPYQYECIRQNNF